MVFVRTESGNYGRSGGKRVRQMLLSWATNERRFMSVAACIFAMMPTFEMREAAAADGYDG